MRIVVGLTLALALPGSANAEMAFEKVFEVWQSETAVVDEGLRLAVRTLDSYSTNMVKAPGPSAFATGKHYLFMPNPGRPRLGTTARIHFSGVEALYLDMFGGPAMVTVDDISMQIGAELQGWHSVNITTDQVCVVVTCEAIEADTEFNIEIEAQEAVLSNIQLYREGNWERPELAGIHRLSEAEGGQLISSVDWERLSGSLFNDAFIVADAQGICASHNRPECEQVRKQTRLYAARLLSILADWPNWRSYDASDGRDFPDSWDRGSWSNGYLPAAFAILLSLPDVKPTEVFVQAWHDMGRAYLDPDTFLPPAHWIRRSTNHAAIIYGNMIGASLLMNNCELDTYVRRLIDDFKAISAAAFRQGFYTESMSYSEVFIPASVFGAVVLSACTSNPLVETVADLYSNRLAEFAQVAKLATFSDGSRWLNYGDCCGSLHWTAGMTAVLALFDSQWASMPVRPSRRPTLFARFRANVAPERENLPERDFACDIFDEAGIAVVQDRMHGMDVRFGVLSTPLHLTHNKDWDLGSFTLVVDGETLIGRKYGLPYGQSRAAISHSTAWIIPTTDEACFGDKPHCSGRLVNGTVIALSDAQHSCSFVVWGNVYKRQHRVFIVARGATGFHATVLDVARLRAGEAFAVNLLQTPGNLAKADVRRQAPFKANSRIIKATQIRVGSAICESSVPKIAARDGRAILIRSACDGEVLATVPLERVLRRP